MDTIIDTRKFPKEMQEQAPRKERKQGGGRMGTLLSWIFISVLIALAVLIALRSLPREEEGAPKTERERMERAIENFEKQTTKVNSAMHEQAVSAFLD